MYKCMECGHLFEEGEQKTWREDRGEFWGNPCYEDMSGCPVCNGSYEEVAPCNLCNGYSNLDEDENYCNECKRELVKRFQSLMNKNFTTEERKALNELFDGKEI